jgi:Ser/Thr protein kinase RdoA (MazF antagonist)
MMSTDAYCRGDQHLETEPTTTDTYTDLTPDRVLDAVEATGRPVSGRMLALNSYENRVYQVGIEDERPVVAKFYRPGRWTREAIAEEHEFCFELAAAEIPVVPPLRDDGGESIYRDGAYWYCVYESVGGRAPYLDNPEELEQLGRLIGRMHAIGATRSFVHRQSLDPTRLGENNIAKVLASGLVPADVEPAYESIARELAARVHQMMDNANRTAGAAESIRLHGDCHVGNVLMRDERIWLVDLDDCLSGPRIQDLWMLLSGDREYRQARLGDVLTGYLDFAEFDPRELQLIEPLRALRMLNYTAWLSERYREAAFQIAFPWFMDRNYWDRHVLELKMQLSELDEPPLIWD